MESHSVNPLNVYGFSKAECERRVTARFPRALVVRTSAFFGPWDQYNFVMQTASRLKEGGAVRAIVDYHVSPTYVPDLVNACLDLLIDRESGIWHITNSGEITWAELARRTAKALQLSDALVESVTVAEMGLTARRPRYSVLGTEKAVLLPGLDDALARFFTDATAN